MRSIAAPETPTVAELRLIAALEDPVLRNLRITAYNFGIHEYFPECEGLHQYYDQVKFGQHPTRKTDAQRVEMREWLVRNVTALLNDESWQDDGLWRPSVGKG